jgi:uncharacterized protein
VLVSAVISPAGPNAEIFDRIADDKIRPYVSQALLDEYQQVFEYERLQHLDRRRIVRLRTLLQRAGIKVKTGGRLKISSHESDNRVYECAVAAKAGYIITENTRHFPKPYKLTKVITARQLLKLLESARPGIL